MKLPLVLALAALTLVPGCVQVEPETPAAAVDADGLADLVGSTGVFHVAPDAPLLDAPFPVAIGAQFSLGTYSTEPTIGANKDGVFMVGYRDGVRGRVPSVIATFDKGQTMADVGPTIGGALAYPQGSFDPMVMVDPATGRVFMDDIWPLSCGVTQWSDDSGKSWTTNPVSCGNPQVNDHQTIGVAKPRLLTTVGYPNVLYRCVNNVADAACAISLNGGLTFTPQVPVYTVADGCTGITGHLQADQEGRMFMAGSLCLSELGGKGPTLWMTDNDGLSWSKSLIAADPNAEPHEVDLAVDEENNLYAMWTSAGLPVLAVSTDHGKTWSEPRQLAPPGVTATMFGAVVAGAPGRVAFAYVGSTIEGGYEGKPTGTGGVVGDITGEPDPEEWRDATWNAYIGLIMDARDASSPIQTVTANDPDDPLARGLCGRTRCHGMNDFLDITLDPEGRPWAAFVDVCTEECVTDPEVRWDTTVGFMGTILEGPALVGDLRALPTIAPPPIVASE